MKNLDMPRRKRAAQPWAKLYMEQIHLLILGEKKVREEIFPLDLPLPAAEKGRAIRMCQEINLAKKQYLEEEHRKRDESERLIAERARNKQEAGNPYAPDLLSWSLKMREAEDGSGLYTFYASPSVGSKRGNGFMLEAAIAFAERAHAPASAGAPLPPAQDAYETYADASPASVDPQEELLAGYLGKGTI